MLDPAKTWDVLVAGGGNAALCAAITARQAGASVLLVEHAPRAMRGGNSRHTRNLRAMHEKPNSVLTDAYLEDEYWDDLLRVTGGNTDEQLARMTIRASGGVFGFMQQSGVRFQPSLSGTLNLGRTNAFFLGGGKALVNAYYLTAERLGIEIVYDSEVLTLPMDHGTVRQVEITYRGFPATVKARCVVVASGGFQANLDWMRQYWGDAVDNFVIRGTPYARGRVLRNLLDQGVSAVGDPTQCHAVALDARAPKFDGGITTRLDSVPFSIVVNRDGGTLLRRGRGFLAQALRHLGPPDRAAAGPDRLLDPRPESGDAVHAVGVSGGARRHAGRAGRKTRPRRGPSWRRRSPPTTPRSDRPRSTTPGWTAARPRASRRPRPTGRAPSISRPSSAIRCGPASPSPIWACG